MRQKITSYATMLLAITMLSVGTVAAQSESLSCTRADGTDGSVTIWCPPVQITTLPTGVPTSTSTPVTMPTATNTPVPPTVAPVLPTMTSVPPTTVPVLPTAVPMLPLGASVLLNKWDYQYSQLERGIQGATKYLPRQFVNGLQIPDVSWGTFTVSNAATYAGWDILYTTNTSDWRTWNQQDWLKLTLQRSGTVALVWRSKGSNPPAWLTQQGWTESAPIATVGSGGNQFGSHRVFTKQIAAGELSLPGVGVGAPAGVSNNTWWVLFGESDGTASAPPPVPAGRTVPVPNTTCPQWVHDQYTAVAADGQAYATWHRAIDPVYWCYFGHEHGDSPDLLGVPDFHPTFHYSATRDGASEFHQGFKGMAWDDPTTGVRHYAVMHFGTGNTNSICQRFHEMQFAGARNGELLFYVQFQADFGVAQQNNTNDVFYLMSKPTCPQGSGPAPGSTGQRQMPVQTSTITGASPNPVFYEPWRLDMRSAVSILGVNMADFMVNNPDPASICRDRTCADPPIVTGKPGAQRFWTVQPAAEVRAPSHVNSQGYFWTTPKATALSPADTLSAVRQFVKPGLALEVKSFINTEECSAVSIWGTEVSTCRTGSSRGAIRNPEQSIGAVN